MNKKDWTPEELKLKEVLNQSYKTDARAPSKPLDLSFMNDAPKKRTVKRRRRLAYIAAAISLVFISSFATAIFISNDYASAIHDKIQRKAFEKEHGVVVVSNGDFAEESETVWEITDFETAKKAKDLVPELPVPEYVPEGYEFEKLILHLYDDNHYIAYYSFTHEEAIICISCQSQEDGFDYSVFNESKTIKLSDRNIIIWRDLTSSLSSATIDFHHSLIIITPYENALTEQELICIATEIQ